MGVSTAFSGKTTREWVGDLLRAGAPYALEFERALDAADEIDGIDYELDGRADGVSLQDEARRLVMLEHRLLSALEDWGAVDPNDPSPPDPINVLRMLLG